MNILLDTLPTSVKEHEAIVAPSKAAMQGGAACRRDKLAQCRRAVTSVISEHGERGSWHLLLPWRGDPKAFTSS